MLNSSIRKIQDQFYKEFESNRKSEKLFERMCTAINRNVFIYRWHPQMFAMRKNTKIFQTVAMIDIQKEILMFIKALCENHHEALQQFMLEQKNYKCQYNMVHLLVTYLATLVKEINAINERPDEDISTQDQTRIPKRKQLSYSHAILALRALSECMQGPCKCNQESIGDSNFLVIANEILTLRFGFGNRRSDHEGCHFTNYQLCKLKNECAILILSLLEQREVDDKIVINMRQCIKESTLVDNIKFVYYSFMLEKDANYSDELLFKVYLTWPSV
ncbi:MAG: hypothetical protein P4M11_02685 [Candidatus Pacebacteria bacterium]|nr:hypothetical protein [Candidatus Paceibacterota bacterium]